MGGKRLETPPAIFLMGPTASGKTGVAVQLVQELPCEIISVDSAMVYRGMDIGTAKPDPAVLRQAPHRLIDIRDPADPYSAAQFRADALREMEEIYANGNVPLLVGGTMLYFRALMQGLSAMPAADAGVRREILAEAERDGWAALHAQLAGIDAQAAARIHPNDPQRIQRALEVFRLTGKPISELQARPVDQPVEYRIHQIALWPDDRDWLHRVIEDRFQRMIADGLVEEVCGLRARPELNPDLPSMRAVGYRQVWAHLAGEFDRDEMLRQALAASRQLAKRQLTWLRGEREVEHFESGQENLAGRVSRYLRARVFAR